MMETLALISLFILIGITMFKIYNLASIGTRKESAYAPIHIFTTLALAFIMWGLLFLSVIGSLNYEQTISITGTTTITGTISDNNYGILSLMLLLGGFLLWFIGGMATVESLVYVGNMVTGTSAKYARS